MDNEQIKRTIEHFKEDGVNVRVRDIAYALLSKMFADTKTAFQCLFGQEGYEEYATDPLREKIDSYLRDEGFVKSMSADADTGGISFEENKREMEALIDRIEQGMEDGTIDPIQGFNQIKDIRVKLNDKFNIDRKQEEHFVVVQKRYNSTCPHCNHEIYIPSKEDLIEEYNLTEKQE